jgi:hypothetical protein
MTKALILAYAPFRCDQCWRQSPTSEAVRMISNGPRGIVVNPPAGESCFVPPIDGSRIPPDAHVA